MASRARRPCSHPGCPELVTSGYCDKHKKQSSEYRRGTAYERGYNYKWSQYSKRFLKTPGNQVCKLRLDGCTYVAECVDHIVPHNGDMKMFWDANNHQAACIHCNSVKGNKTLKGEG